MKYLSGLRIETDAATPAYLVLADTFDPGWSAVVDGQPAPIRPAYVAFRAVYLPQGKHAVVFTYRPAGFDRGLLLTGTGILLGFVLWFWPWRTPPLAAEHSELSWPSHSRTWWFVGLGAIVLVSAVEIGGRRSHYPRWPVDRMHPHAHLGSRQASDESQPTVTAWGGHESSAFAPYDDHVFGLFAAGSQKNEIASHGSRREFALISNIG